MSDARKGCPECGAFVGHTAYCDVYQRIRQAEDKRRRELFSAKCARMVGRTVAKFEVGYGELNFTLTFTDGAVLRLSPSGPMDGHGEHNPYWEIRETIREPDKDAVALLLRIP